MFQTRKSASKKLPILRKGSKYIARASSHLRDSVPVVIAVRDMLKLARTAKEVKKMIQQGNLKINGRAVEDYRESILLFNIFEADKAYELSLLPTKRFTFVPAKNKNLRLCRVVNKRLVKSGLTQINLHDGTNIISKDKVKVNDTIYLDAGNKVKKVVEFEEGKDIFIISGKYAGSNGKIKKINGNEITVDIKGDFAELKIDSAVVL